MPPTISPTDAISTLQQQVDQQHQSMMQNQMLRNAMLIGQTSLGLGVGARGLWSLLNQISRNARKPRPSIPAPSEVEIPVEEVDKYAEDEGILGQLKQTGDNLVGGTKDMLKKYFGGGYASTPTGVPWALPLYTGAALGGVGGGWTITDWLMDRRRRKVMREELEQAKQEYNDALFGKIGAVLDELYDNLQESEKQASDGSWGIGNAAGIAGGAGLTYAGLSSLATALAAYNMAKQRQRRTLLERAQKERMRQRYEQMPSPIYAVPIPVARDPAAEESGPFGAGLSLRPPDDTKIASLKNLVATVGAAHSGL